MKTEIVKKSDSSLVPYASEEELMILDPNSETGVSQDDAGSRINAIATISAGYKKEGAKFPGRTEHGEIYVHGDAPGLKRVLKENGGTYVTALFHSDNLTDFIQMRFARYSASSVEAYGDDKEIVVVEKGQRKVWAAGTPEYKAEIKKCKVSVSVYFMLAQWSDKGAGVFFPDGVGLYRMRCTSLNSLRSIKQSLLHVKEITRGKLAGIPIDLFLRQEERQDSSGSRRTVWIWQARLRPPQEVNSADLRSMLDHSQAQLDVLALPAPPKPETIDMAIKEAELIGDDDMDEGVPVEGSGSPTMDDFAEEAKCDADHWRKRFHAVAKGTRFATDEMRKKVISKITDGKFDSLSEYLKTITENEANTLIALLQGYIDKDKVRTLYAEYLKKCRKVNEIYKDSQDRQWPERFAGDNSAESLESYIKELDKIIEGSEKAKEATKNLSSDVRRVRDEATIDDEPDRTEDLFGHKGDEPQEETAKELAADLFDAEEVVEAEVVDVPPLSTAKGHLLASAQKAGFDHQGDLSHGGLCSAINAHMKAFRIKERIKSIDDLTDIQAGLVCSHLDNGKMVGP